MPPSLGRVHAPGQVEGQHLPAEHAALHHQPAHLRQQRLAHLAGGDHLQPARVVVLPVGRPLQHRHRDPVEVEQVHPQRDRLTRGRGAGVHPRPVHRADRSTPRPAAGQHVTERLMMTLVPTPDPDQLPTPVGLQQCLDRHVQVHELVTGHVQPHHRHRRRIHPQVPLDHLPQQRTSRLRARPNRVQRLIHEPLERRHHIPRALIHDHDANGSPRNPHTRRPQRGDVGHAGMTTPSPM